MVPADAAGLLLLHFESGSQLASTLPCCGAVGTAAYCDSLTGIPMMLWAAAAGERIIHQYKGSTTTADYQERINKLLSKGSAGGRIHKSPVPVRSAAEGQQ